MRDRCGMKDRKHRILTLAILGGLAGAGLALQAFQAQDPQKPEIGELDKEKAAKAFPAKPTYSPYAGRNYPSRPYFGDTHLHTSFSLDAGAFGARLGPRDAYRFARGEEVTASSGQQAKLSRPLDFLVVADHSDNMGFFPDLFAGKPEVLAHPTGRKWYDMIKSGKGADAALEIIIAFSQGTFPKDADVLPGHARLPGRVAGDHRRSRALQRTGALHRIHRLRVDLQHWRQQSASQHRLPGQRGESQTRRAVTRSTHPWEATIP